MKKTILALAAALVAGSAFATTVVPATGSVTGSASSQVSGGTSSFSIANLPGQTSYHGSIATAQNCTTVVGIARPGTNGATAATLAVTAGSTYTAGGGSGLGGTSAGASQFGFGTVTATANIAGDATGSVSASSTVATGTLSTVSTTNSGSGFSGTKAGAVNASMALAGSSALENGVSVRTAGVSVGVDGVKTFGNTSPENATITAMGTLTLGEGEGALQNVGSYQGGSFDASIVRNYTASPTGIGGPGGCVSGTCGGDNGGGDDPEHPSKPPKGPKGNNGYGNGDQGAPGNSGPSNNAENGNQGGSGSNGKPRKPN